MGPFLAAVRVGAAPLARNSSPAGAVLTRTVSSKATKMVGTASFGVKMAAAAYAGLGCTTVGLGMQGPPPDSEEQGKAARKLSRITRAIE